MLGVVGPLSICVLLVVLGLLSRRLGRGTHASPYYVGFFVAAALVAISAVARGVHVFSAVEVNDSMAWVVVYNGFPALGVTLGVVIAWRYWSWLLAERD